MSDPFHALTSTADWTDALDRSADTPVLIYKHSSACPVSTQAQTEVQELAEAVPDLPVYRVVVQEHRTVSDEIEETLGVRHETPQALLLSDRTAVFDTSHFDVTAETLRDALDDAAVSSE
jgi:bacillithiol system protein YtxJ